MAVNDTQPVITCGFPVLPDNGKIDAVNFLDGSITTFSCNDYYILTGAERTTCANGNWTELSPMCIRKYMGSALLM